MKYIRYIVLACLATLTVACRKDTSINLNDFDVNGIYSPELKLREGYSDWSVIGHFMGTDYDRDFRMEVFRSRFQYQVDEQYWTSEVISYLTLRNVKLIKGDSFRIRKNGSWDINRGWDYVGTSPRPLDSRKAVEALVDGAPILIKEDGCYEIQYFPDREAIVIYKDYTEDRLERIPVFRTGESVNTDPVDDEPTETGYDQTPFSTFRFNEEIGGTWVKFKEEMDLGNEYTFMLHVFIEGQDGDAPDDDYWQARKMRRILGFTPTLTPIGEYMDYENEDMVDFRYGIYMPLVGAYHYSADYDYDLGRALVENGKWYSVAISSGQDGGAVYVNGVRVSPDYCLSNKIGSFSFSAIGFGNDNGNWGGGPESTAPYKHGTVFPGRIAFMSLWDKALTLREINRNSFRVPQGEGLKLFWTLTDGDGSVFKEGLGHYAFDIDFSSCTVVKSESYEELSHYRYRHFYQEADYSEFIDWVPGNHWPKDSSEKGSAQEEL